MKKKVTVAGCFVFHKGKFLLLKRAEHDSFPLHFGLPAGSVEDDESVVEGLLREVSEESGYKLEVDKLEKLGSWDFKYTKYDLLFHAFRYELDEYADPVLNPKEHIDYIWVTPEEAYERTDMISGMHKLLRNAKIVCLEKSKEQ